MGILDRAAMLAGAIDRQFYRRHAAFEVAQDLAIGGCRVGMGEGLADVPGQISVWFGLGAAQIGGCAGRAEGVRRAGKTVFAIEGPDRDSIIALAVSKSLLSERNPSAISVLVLVSDCPGIGRWLTCGSRLSTRSKHALSLAEIQSPLTRAPNCMQMRTIRK